MLSTKTLRSLALVGLLLFSESTIAAPHSGKPNVNAKIHKRDDAGSSTSSGPTAGPTASSTSSSNDTATLEPVVPPDVNQDSLSTLLGTTNLTLAWAGAPSTTPGSRKKLKRDEGVLSQATFTFKYPTVPLDHSNFVSNVACSGNVLTGVLSDQAYTYAKSKWATLQNLVFVTSVDGCGMDNANDYFLATSVSFTDGSKSFSATGASAGPKDVSSYMVLEWGAVGATKLKRSINKEDMFEPHASHKRGTHEIGISVPFRAYAHEILGSDMDAPWENAWKVGEISKDIGEKDDSWEKGEVASDSGHHKRSNETGLGLYQRDLVEREASYGMALYCVDCGFEGRAGLYGRLETDWFDIVGLGAGFRMDFKAGIYLGLVAYVKYEKEWPKEIAHVNLAGWEIPVIISVGPFIDVSLVPSFEISASGSLLIGAGIEWDNVDIYLDFLHPIDRSYAHNLSPSFQHRIEAAGELSVEAKLALPVKLGIEVKILQNFFTGNWIFNAEAAIVEEPAIVAEGKFEVSAEVTDDGEIEYDINGGCYGVAWDIHFENDLYFEAKADFFGLGDGGQWPLLSFESDPFAEGCIGYVDDGTDDDDDNPQGVGDSTGATGNGLNSGGNGLSGGSNSDDDSNGAVAVLKAAKASLSSTSSLSSTVTSSTLSSSSSVVTSKTSSTAQVLVQTTSSQTSTSTKAQTTSSTTSSSSKAPTTTSSSQSTSSSTSSSKITSTSTTQIQAQAQPTTTSKTSSSSTLVTTTSSKPTTSSSSTSSSTSFSKSTSTSQVQAQQTTTSKTSSSSTSTTSQAKTTSTTSPVQAQQTTTSKSSTSTSSSTTSKAQTTSSSTTSKPQTTTSSTTSKPQTTSSSTSTKTTSTSTSTTPTCTASQSAVAKSPTPTGTITCKSTATAAAVPTSLNLSAATTAKSADDCGTACLKDTKCLSFSWNDSSKSCQLYTKAVKSLGTTTKSGNPTLVFWDRDCYAYNTCPAK